MGSTLNSSMQPLYSMRIAVFGCRNIAAASIYSLMNIGDEVEILLYGSGADSLRREVEWLCSTVPPKRHPRLRIGHHDDLGAAGIALISSGDAKRPGETDEDHLKRNAVIISKDAALLRSAGFSGVLIVTTSPAEVMAHVALDISGLDERKVIGLGYFSQMSDEMPAGEELPIAAWCTAGSAENCFMDSCQPDCPYFEATLNARNRFQHSPNSPRSEMASCVMRLCEAIIRDENTVLPVAAMTQGEFGINDGFLTLPCIIDVTGIRSVLGRKLLPEELEQLRNTAQFIRNTHGSLFKSESAATA